MKLSMLSQAVNSGQTFNLPNSGRVGETKQVLADFLGAIAFKLPNSGRADETCNYRATEEIEATFNLPNSGRADETLYAALLEWAKSPLSTYPTAGGLMKPR